MVYVHKVKERREITSFVNGLGFVPSSLQSSVEAAHEAIHVIERKGMSYLLDHRVQQFL
jgi:predicted xylose isomerase-like sugar epimerase